MKENLFKRLFDYHCKGFFVDRPDHFFSEAAQTLLDALVARFAPLPQVEAIALGGSQATGSAGEKSDFDLYVYVHQAIPLDVRRAIAEAYAEQPEIDNTFWGPGDEWVESRSGLGVDLIYFSPQWMEDQIDRVLIRHQPSVGYSTCFWFTVRESLLLHDRDGWFARLKAKADQPYPEPLRRAIVANNHPILRRTISSYVHQIEKAVQRRDRISLNHRAAALIASYFDILFALNRVPHPGEKRLAAWAERLCPNRPARMAEDLAALIRATAAPWEDQSILACVHTLVDGLDRLLLADGLIDESGRLL